MHDCKLNPTIAIEDFLSPRSSLSCTLKMCRCVLEGVSPQTASFGRDISRRSQLSMLPQTIVLHVHVVFR